MTRRERMERRLERRQEWAEGRSSKAAALLKRNEPFRGDIAFNTQPGHIPERARVIRRSEKAFEHDQMAARHRGVADSLARALDKNIFSDDENAVEALEERIAKREAVAERTKALNKAIRKEMKASGGAFTEGWAERVGATEAEALKIRNNVEFSWDHKPTFPSYVLTNLRGRITADRKRLAQVKRERATEEGS